MKSLLVFFCIFVSDLDRTHIELFSCLQKILISRVKPPLTEYWVLLSRCSLKCGAFFQSQWYFRNELTVWNIDGILRDFYEAALNDIVDCEFVTTRTGSVWTEPMMLWQVLTRHFFCVMFSHCLFFFEYLPYINNHVWWNTMTNRSVDSGWMGFRIHSQHH